MPRTRVRWATTASSDSRPIRSSEICPGRHLVGQVADGGRLGPAEAGRGQILGGYGQDGSRGHRTPQRLLEATVDGGGGLAGQLLVEDDLGQGREPPGRRGRSATGRRTVALDERGQHLVPRRQLGRHLGLGRSGHGDDDATAFDIAGKKRGTHGRKRLAWESRISGPLSRFVGGRIWRGTSSSPSTAAPWSGRAGTSARTTSDRSSRWARWPPPPSRTWTRPSTASRV